MTMHTCLLCLGSNLDASTRLTAARSALLSHFPHIRFSEEMVTEAIGSGFLSPFHNQVASLETSLSAEAKIPQTKSGFSVTVQAGSAVRS